MKIQINIGTEAVGFEVKQVDGGILIAEAKSAAIDPTEVTGPSYAAQIKARLTGFNRGRPLCPHIAAARLSAGH